MVTKHHTPDRKLALGTYSKHAPLLHFPVIEFPTGSYAMTTTSQTSRLTAAIVNPLMGSTRDVFTMMLGCEPVRESLTLRNSKVPAYDLSAVIGITGGATGTVVFSVARQTALNIVERMLGMKVEEVNADVLDAVGEITNMIAGSAKAKFASLNLSISTPNIISGSNHEIHYPTSIQPICLNYQSDVGKFCLEAGFAPA